MAIAFDGLRIRDDINWIYLSFSANFDEADERKDFGPVLKDL